MTETTSLIQKFPVGTSYIKNGEPSESSLASRKSQRFAEWLATSLAVTASAEIEVSDPVEEEADWDIVVQHEERNYSVSVALLESEQAAEPQEWVITVMPEITFGSRARYEEADSNTVNFLCAVIRHLMKGNDRGNASVVGVLSTGRQVKTSVWAL